MIRDSRMRAIVHHEPITPVSGAAKLSGFVLHYARAVEVDQC